MAPVEVQLYDQPISRTYQYRKVMKPMLERKRRARINRCLDELKELMVGALHSEGENVSKLEKADVLELTVRHLHKLKRQQLLSGNPVREVDRFRSGFTHCAQEVSRCLAAIPGVDVHLGTKLMTHLGHTMNQLSQAGSTRDEDEVEEEEKKRQQMQKALPLMVHVPQQAFYSSPPLSPQSASSFSGSSNLTLHTTLTPMSSVSSGYCSGCDTCPSSPCSNTKGLLQIASPPLTPTTTCQDLWRPW